MPEASALDLASIDALREGRSFELLQWLDVVLGYRAVHYQPAELDPNDPRQELFVGISLNLQRLVDRTLMPERGARTHAGAGALALRFASEVIALPFTTLAIGGLSRTGTQGIAARGSDAVR